MRVPLILRFSTLLAGAALSVSVSQAQFSSNTISSSPLKVETTTTVPGASLKPGSYTIRVIDNLKDRYILSVADEGSKDLATFIGMLQHHPLPGQSGLGPILWANAPGKTNALRGFSFANGQAFEFVYPKATAVELAKINASSVPAIDPESEGMPVDPKLSPEDRKVVTLWLLTSTRVGPGKGIPAIEARRAEPTANTELAQVWSPAPRMPGKPVVAANVVPSQPVKSQPVNTSVAHASADTAPKVRTRTVAAKLPQTGSDLPLIFLVSGGLLVAGFGVAAGRRMTSASMTSAI